MPGPVPNRTDDLSRKDNANRPSRHNSPVTKGLLRDVRWPKAKPEWCDIAKELYRSARTSGQADFYQQTDIAMLRFMCDEVTAYLEPRPLKDRDGNPVLDPETGEPKTYIKRSPMHLATIMSGLTELVLTEGARRRARIELEAEPEQDDAELIAIDGYRKELGLDTD